MKTDSVKDSTLLPTWAVSSPKRGTCNLSGQTDSPSKSPERGWGEWGPECSDLHKKRPRLSTTESLASSPGKAQSLEGWMTGKEEAVTETLLLEGGRETVGVGPSYQTCLKTIALPAGLKVQLHSA